jgi:flavin-dependent dehydrogenase
LPARRSAGGILRREHAHGWRLLDAPLVAGPFRSGRAACGNAIKADAAGFFDGITGEGMSLALVSARHCAEAVDEFLATGSAEPLRRYERRRRSLARNSEILGRMTLALASREWTARRALRGLARRPETFAKLVAVSSGEARLWSLP